MRQVVADRNEVTVSEVTTKKAYVMKGEKGDYILARDTAGYFIWVRLTPSEITKPCKKFETIKEAIASKIEAGYDVFEYTEAFVG